MEKAGKRRLCEMRMHFVEPNSANALEVIFTKEGVYIRQGQSSVSLTQEEFRFVRDKSYIDFGREGEGE